MPEKNGVISDLSDNVVDWAIHFRKVLGTKPQEYVSPVWFVDAHKFFAKLELDHPDGSDRLMFSTAVDNNYLGVFPASYLNVKLVLPNSGTFLEVWSGEPYNR